MRDLIVALLLASLSVVVTGSARAARTLPDVLNTLVQEVEIREQEIGGTPGSLIRNSREARALRRGREALTKAIARHEKGRFDRAAPHLAKGLKKLGPALRDQDFTPGIEALDLVYAHLIDWNLAASVWLEERLHELPDSKKQRRARALLQSIDRERADHYPDRVDALAHYADIGVAEKLIAKAEARIAHAACPLTHPDKPFDGGGWIRVSVDGGPEQTWKAYGGQSLLSPTKRLGGFGSERGVRPRIVFGLIGKRVTQAGKHPIQHDPPGEEPFPNRDFAVGWITVDDPEVHSVKLSLAEEGHLTIDKYKTGKRRLIEGSFEAAYRHRGVRHTLEGTFHICNFGVERAGGKISLPK